MKKRLLYGLALVAFVGIILGIINNESVHADSNRETYFAGETVYADLDGDGKNETIQVKESSSYSYKYGMEYITKWTLMVNGKEVASHTFKESDLRSLTFFSILDIYTKDKCKEIGINFGSADEDMGENYVEVYQYSNGKASLRFKHYTYLRYIVDGQKKKNTVKISTAKYCAFGSPFFDVTYKIKSKALVEDSSKLYVGLSNYEPYIAATQINVYKKTNLKKKVATINKNDQFTVTKVKADKNGQPIYAYVKTSSGKKGWISIKEFWTDWKIIVQNPFVFD
ncbi:MAG: hypothetical protein IKW90_11955 [Lachnospiraceae bacterium]|nr:hypothetical protein [Lachnospiraceae bacterium]